MARFYQARFFAARYYLARFFRGAGGPPPPTGNPMVGAVTLTPVINGLVDMAPSMLGVATVKPVYSGIVTLDR